MHMKRKGLMEEIEHYKKLLDLTVEIYGCSSDQTITISQKLNILFNRYYGLTRNNK
ncbi:MAG: Spo0E like sporulation regulatory protein [Herbinix sp.]|jgi:hypothetical protein|nr:Spo0E like sporulation regulatory protein [Herbinix sp.]